MEPTNSADGQLQTIVVNQRSYSYYISPFVLTNTLGFVRAVLKEYLVTGADGETYKLYKTTERNWYDVEDANPAADTVLLRLLKIEIDYQEKTGPVG